MNFTWIIGLLLVGVSASAAYISWHIWQLVPFGILGKWLAVGSNIAVFLLPFSKYAFRQDANATCNSTIRGGHVVYIYRLILANAVCGV